MEDIVVPVDMIRGLARMDEHEIDDKKNTVPFTARIIAHYRAMETNCEKPLIVDPYAERLAGDMTAYFKEHKRTRGTGDYAVVRTYYIDKHLLAPWCDKHKKSQIVLLGAGLDARAYRLEPLQKNEHTLFEIDFDIVNSYKAGILQDDQPLCDLVRISADLSEPAWISQLEKEGFLHDIPTFWLLEGLVYYIDQEMVISVLRTAAKSCGEGSQIFADVCVPGLTLAQFGPFMMHFKWGLDKEDVPQFFARSGWNVTCAFADDYDQGRDVGQRGLMFVTGLRDLSRLGVPLSLAESVDDGSMKIPESEIQSFSKEFIKKIIPEIEDILDSYQNNPDVGMTTYLEFIKKEKPTLQRIMKSFNNLLSIGQISSRLLRDPSTIVLHTREEEEAHIVGYLKAILYLGYCGAKGLAGEQFSITSLHKLGVRIQTADKMQSLVDLVREDLQMATS